MTPVEREAPWTVWARFAIEAASGEEAQAIADTVFAEMNVTFAGPPRVARIRPDDNLWAVTADVDLTVLESLAPDDARTRLGYVTHGLGPVKWGSRVSERQGKWDWPPDLWSRQPGTDDVLGHPAVRAAIIWAAAE